MCDDKAAQRTSIDIRLMQKAQTTNETHASTQTKRFSIFTVFHCMTFIYRSIGLWNIAAGTYVIKRLGQHLEVAATLVAYCVHFDLKHNEKWLKLEIVDKIRNKVPSAYPVTITYVYVCALCISHFISYNQSIRFGWTNFPCYLVEVEVTVWSGGIGWGPFCSLAIHLNGAFSARYILHLLSFNRFVSATQAHLMLHCTF